MSKLQDYVCLVTGASRGIGKGIALGLADLGATVYITGRTLRSSGSDATGSLEETASEINARGGKAAPVVVDHSKEKEVEDLFDRIRIEQHGRLDVVVNNAYSAVPFLLEHMNKPYYEITAHSPGHVWDTFNNVGLRNHYICSTLATRLMLSYRSNKDASTNPGIIINVSSIGGKMYLFNTAYGVGKAAIDRMTNDMAVELKRQNANISVISLWPGIVRTENMISTNNPQSNSDFHNLFNPEFSESPELSGLAVAALLTESPGRLLNRSGHIVMVSDIAQEYKLVEPGGSTPPNYRCVKLLLRLGGYHSLARWVPGFIHIPTSLFHGVLTWFAK